MKSATYLSHHLSTDLKIFNTRSIGVIDHEGPEKNVISLRSSWGDFL